MVHAPSSLLLFSVFLLICFLSAFFSHEQHPSNAFFASAAALCSTSSSQVQFVVFSPTAVEPAHTDPSTSWPTPLHQWSGIQPHVTLPPSELRFPTPLNIPTSRRVWVSALWGLSSRLLTVNNYNSFFCSSSVRDGSYVLQLLYLWYPRVLFLSFQYLINNFYWINSSLYSFPSV